MTKNEIAEFFGYCHMTHVAKAFRKAEEECPSIKQKKNHYNKNNEIDYTLEETLIAMKYYEKSYNPCMERMLIEHFIHRDTPVKTKHKKVKVDSEASRWLFACRVLHTFQPICASCAFFSLKQPLKQGVGVQPYCNLFDCFIKKVNPKTNIYKDRCPSYEIGSTTNVYIKTSIGYFKQSDFDERLKLKQFTDDSMMGISQSEFKSKRKRNEPIVLLKDAFQ